MGWDKIGLGVDNRKRNGIEMKWDRIDGCCYCERHLLLEQGSETGWLAEKRETRSTTPSKKATRTPYHAGISVRDAERGESNQVRGRRRTTGQRQKGKFSIPR